MRISKFTLFFSIYLIISPLFMQQVWNAWRAIFGIGLLRLFIILICLAAVVAILYKNIKSGLNIKKIGLICAVSVWGFIFAWRQPYFSEKAHVLQFALLGWLVMRDLLKKSRGLVEPLDLKVEAPSRAVFCEGLKDVMTAFMFVTIVGFLEEGFQKFLPWRVYEIRDIITDSLSGGLGIILFVISR